MGMTYKEIVESITTEPDEDTCELCEVHKQAFKLLQEELPCPYCGKDLLMEHYSFTEAVVGETNGCDENETLEIRQVGQCRYCQQYLMLSLKPIIYNGNHDIYYTGGKRYLTKPDFELFKEEIQEAGKEMAELAEQYRVRRLQGEDLNETHMKLWLKRCAENLAAAILAKLDKGAKI